MALLSDKELTVANVGDSRGVLCDKNGKAIPLSHDHKPYQLKERKRIKKAGEKAATLFFFCFSSFPEQRNKAKNIREHQIMKGQKYVFLVIKAHNNSSFFVFPELSSSLTEGQRLRLCYQIEAENSHSLK